MITAGQPSDGSTRTQTSFAITTDAAMTIVNAIRSGQASSSIVLGPRGFLGVQVTIECSHGIAGRTADHPWGPRRGSGPGDTGGSERHPAVRRDRGHRRTEGHLGQLNGIGAVRQEAGRCRAGHVDRCARHPHVICDPDRRPRALDQTAVLSRTIGNGRPQLGSQISTDTKRL